MWSPSLHDSPPAASDEARARLGAETAKPKTRPHDLEVAAERRQVGTQLFLRGQRQRTGHPPDPSRRAAAQCPSAASRASRAASPNQGALESGMSQKAYKEGMVLGKLAQFRASLPCPTLATPFHYSRRVARTAARYALTSSACRRNCRQWRESGRAYVLEARTAHREQRTVTTTNEYKNDPDSCFSSRSARILLAAMLGHVLSRVLDGMTEPNSIFINGGDA